MENIDTLNIEHLAENFRSSLASVRAAEDLYDRADQPEVEAVQVLQGALDAANAAADRILALPATNLSEIKIKARALTYRWRASDFDPSQVDDNTDFSEFYGERALAAFTDLAADIEAMA